jgi:Asp-tRNA(Asn)/Glu-tRNA(Gln) amidotransferase A subunit family amidase
MTDFADYSALRIAREIASGTASVEEIAVACLDRVDAREADILAWAYLDREQFLSAARASDRYAGAGLLRGVPFAAKDIIDTVDMPTAHGSPIYESRQPSRDATCVAMCRAGGGLLMGKTVTTEFAHVFPGDTRNPHDATRTPGGSSSGSAAAVSAGMVPLAFGTQTTGSVIRPASYCGVVGYKPSYGDFGLSGVGQNSPSFDTLGVMARDVADLALMRAAVMGAPYRAMAPRDLASLRLGLCRTPYWDDADATTQLAIERAAEQLSRAGAQISDFDAPGGYAAVGDAHIIVSGYEFARVLAYERSHHEARLSKPLLTGRVADGLRYDYNDYRAALATIAAYRARFAAAFNGYDAILTPSAAGVAPKGLASTGSSRFNGVWTALHAPAVTLPVLEGEAGLPLGLQLIGATNKDDAFLDVAGAVFAALS